MELLHSTQRWYSSTGFTGELIIRGFKLRWNVKFEMGLVRCRFFLKQIIEVIFSCLRERRSLRVFDCTPTQTGPSVAAARS